METMTVEQFRTAIKEQGVSQRELVCFVCPMCGTVQNGADLIAAGAGSKMDDVENHLEFSCLGRFSHRLPPYKTKGKAIGCNWTLGGLFSLHTLEVIDDSGNRHPHFAVATQGQAAVHLLDRIMTKEEA